MKNNIINKYKTIASIVSNGNVRVFVGAKKENPSKTLLINEFDKSYKKNLLSFFSMQSSMVNSIVEDFSISKENFYIAFKYQKGCNVKDKFTENLNIYNLQSRINMVEKFLIEVNTNSYLPLNIRLCSLEPANLVVNLEDEIKSNYNLSNISNYDNSGEKDLFKSISIMLKIVFNHEINIVKNQYIRLVVQKCQHNLYKTIPELIVELKKAYKKQGKNSLLLKLKYLIKIHKKKVDIATRVVPIIAASVVVCIIAYNLLNQQKEGKYFKIGNIEYNAALADTKDNTIKITQKTQEINIIPIDLSLPADTVIEFEDYIVKPDDTLSGICSFCYSDPKFINTIKSYNNIRSDDDLAPGTILKIPNETLVKDYFSI